MGQTSSKQSWLPDQPEPVAAQQNSLRQSAVAVDPPPSGAVGIRELLARLEVFNDENHTTGGEENRSDAHNPSSARWSLGDLADPANFTGPLKIGSWAPDQLKPLLSDMISIRKAEQGLAELVEQGHVKCPVHLAVGQEAIPVGVSRNLTNADRVFGGHRSHGHYLAMGGDLYSLFAEVLGKEDGCSGGMGGSMHLHAPEQGFWGSVPIVAATVSIAVGAALAARMDGSDAVAVAYFGDGAVEEGSVHESLNLASKMKLPVLFVCENNFYASHMDIAQRQPSDCTARFADAHCIDWAVVDENDVISVAEVSQKMIGNARNGGGPAYLEAVTYRWYGHVGPDENIDVGNRRSQEEITAWKRRDPVARLKQALLVGELISEQEFQIMEDRTAQAVATAVVRAMAAPYPEEKALLDRVYFQPTAQD